VLDFWLKNGKLFMSLISLLPKIRGRMGRQGNISCEHQGQRGRRRRATEVWGPQGMKYSVSIVGYQEGGRQSAAHLTGQGRGRPGSRADGQNPSLTCRDGPLLLRPVTPTSSRTALAERKERTHQARIGWGTCPLGTRTSGPVCAQTEGLLALLPQLNSRTPAAKHTPDSYFPAQPQDSKGLTVTVCQSSYPQNTTLMKHRYTFFIFTYKQRQIFM
jgi:hypothetical protein